MTDTKQCYIRRKNSHWQDARAHHERALQLYLTTYVARTEPGTMPPTELISTEHDDDGFINIERKNKNTTTNTNTNITINNKNKYKN